MERELSKHTMAKRTGVFLTSVQSRSELPPPGDEEEFPEDDVSYSSSEEEQPDPVKVQHRRRQVANRLASLMTWTEGPVLNSDEYDTDLEEDFPPGKGLSPFSSKT